MRQCFNLFHETACPACKTVQPEAFALDAGSEKRAPRAGDYAMCQTCKAPLVFVDGHTMRLANAEEKRELVARVRDALAHLTGAS